MSVAFGSRHLLCVLAGAMPGRQVLLDANDYLVVLVCFYLFITSAIVTTTITTMIMKLLIPVAGARRFKIFT